MDEKYSFDDVPELEPASSPTAPDYAMEHFEEEVSGPKKKDILERISERQALLDAERSRWPIVAACVFWPLLFVAIWTFGWMVGKTLDLAFLRASTGAATYGVTPWICAISFEVIFALVAFLYFRLRP